MLVGEKNKQKMTGAAARGPAKQPAQFSRGYLALGATIALWSLPSLFQYYLLRFYEPWSQNFYRYSVACLAILPFAFLRRRGRKPMFTARSFLLCLLPALPNVVHQIAQTVALLYIGPGVYAVFGRTTVIATAILAVIFFPEERGIVRQWRFQLGTFLGLLGAVGVFWFQPGNVHGHVALRGLLVASTAVICWALYSTLVKPRAMELGSVRSFATISLITSLLLLPLTCIFGRIGTPLHVPPSISAMMILSAVLCITIAHVLFYVAIQEIGVALAQTLTLLCPLGALGLSALIFHERLTSAQVVSSVILLAGAFLAMRVKPPLPAAAENI